MRADEIQLALFESQGSGKQRSGTVHCFPDPCFRMFRSLQQYVIQLVRQNASRSSAEAGFASGLDRVGCVQKSAEPVAIDLAERKDRAGRCRGLAQC